MHPEVPRHLRIERTDRAHEAPLPDPASRALTGGRRAGFSLIEMAVVMVIFGIAIAAAVPSFTHRNSWARLQGDAMELSSRMQVARQAAVARRVPYRLTLSQETLSFTVERQETDGSWVADPDQEFELKGTEGMVVDIGDAVGASVIHFQTRGTIEDSDAPTRIRLISPMADTATVVLVRTGRVTTRLASGSE